MLGGRAAPSSVGLWGVRAQWPRGPASTECRLRLTSVGTIRKNVMTTVSRLLQSRSGVTSIEYAFIAMLIALAIVTAVNLVGTSLSSDFQNVAADI